VVFLLIVPNSYSSFLLQFVVHYLGGVSFPLDPAFAPLFLLVFGVLRCRPDLRFLSDSIFLFILSFVSLFDPLGGQSENIM